jgi:hypothetical protein
MFVVNDFRRDCAIRTGVRRAGTDDRLGNAGGRAAEDDGWQTLMRGLDTAFPCVRLWAASICQRASIDIGHTIVLEDSLPGPCPQRCATGCQLCLSYCS